MKEKMDKLLTVNYDHLLTVAKNITKRYSSTNKDMCYDLLHTCVIKVYNNIDKSNNFLTDDVSFTKYFTKYLKQRFEWQKFRCYSFDENHKDNELFTYRPILEINNNSDYKGDKSEDLIVEPLAEELIILEAENVDDITKLYLKDLLVNDIPVNRGLDYQKILDIAKKLDPLTYELFYLIYIEEMTVKKIHNQLINKIDNPMSYRELLILVKEMKIKINEKMQCLK